MGGLGSGGHNHSGRRTTADAHRLDVNKLRRAGVLTEGWIGGWQWTSNGQKSADIQIRTGVTTITLIYRTREREGLWREVEQPIGIAWESCRFGGQRPYMRCPGCDQLVETIYLIGNARCRTCHRLVYPSQRERELDRACRKVRKIRERIGVDLCALDGPCYGKPKGMHWKTFDRVLRDDLGTMQMVHSGIMSKFGAINDRLGKMGTDLGFDPRDFI